MLTLFILSLIFTTSVVALQPLDIHVIAHTHDDVGWLKTVDQYTYGSNNTIQDARVQYILDSVIYELQQNPERRFIYVEQAFFVRWWREQSAKKQAVVRELVRNGQFEFVNGGWCMNDEAGTHYEATIDQMTLGHQFILKEFGPGAVPTIGWHIDPFGHSTGQATMFAKMGFNAFFFARIDYQDYQRRNVTRELEIVWQPSRSLPTADSQIFTHMLYEARYGPPDGFCFQCGNVPPIKDDHRLFGYNLVQRADLFAKRMRTRSKEYRTPHLLVTFGSDFQFANANINFKNMDKLMAYLNGNFEKYGLRVKYSTPSRYIAAVHDANLSWPSKQDDYFPYADRPHAYWSGYFTSRPALKGYVRSTNGVYHAVAKLAFSASVATADRLYFQRMAVLQDALGVSQHHDAVAGTEKQHVADDYAKRLAMGRAAGNLVAQDALRATLGNGVHAELTFTACPYLNISVCPVLQNVQANAAVVPLVLYNSLAWQRTELVRLPVPYRSAFVTNATGSPMPAQLLPDARAVHTLAFPVKVPPMGYTTVFVHVLGDNSGQLGPGVSDSKVRTVHSVTTAAAAAATIGRAQAVGDDDPNYIANNAVRIDFSAETGLMTSFRSTFDATRVQIKQQFLWYNESAGNNEVSSQADGAYIFRPNQSTPFPINPSTNNLPTLVLVTGPLVQEARQTWADWVQQTTRLWTASASAPAHEQQFAELDSSVGPIPIADGLGKEVIARFSTDLANQRTWFTDAQGLEMQRRQYNYRPTWNLTVNEPVAGNYFPKNSAAYLQDGTRRFTIVTDRSSGCGSLQEGQLEFMLHRRLLHDDGRGVGEALNETEGIVARGNVFVASHASSSQLQRQRALHINHPLQLWFGTPLADQSPWARYQTQFAPLNGPLPPNVHLLSLDVQENGATSGDHQSVLVRLHHIFAKGEHPVLSQPATVHLDRLFKSWTPAQINEVTLSANQPVANLKKRLVWKVEGQNLVETVDSATAGEDPYAIEIKAMDVRSFFVIFKKN